MATCDECRWKVEQHECPWDFQYKNTDYAEDCIDFRNINQPYDAFEYDKRDLRKENDIFRKDFKTDGELYDSSLTRNTKEEAFQLYQDIISKIEKYAAVDIFDIVCLISHFPAPRNWVYARSHGYDRFDVVNFNVRKIDDGKKWCVYLGSPKKLW